MKRYVRILSTALITAGAVVMTDVALTLLWQEFASAAHAWLNQREVDGELEQLEREYGRRLGTDPALDPARVRRLADRLAGTVEPGDALGRLSIEEVGLDIAMVEGTDTTSLQKGPGHYPETSLPGKGGT